MNKFTFIYIATDTYINCFNDFILSLVNFCPKIIKSVKLLTDNTNYDISQYQFNNISIEKYYIPHMPWPINTLFKFHYISNFINDDFDLIWYCNANFRFNNLDNINNIIENNDLFYFSYINKEGKFSYWQDIFGELKYVQGGLFFSNKESIHLACDFIIKTINDNLYHNYITDKHDETILNIYHEKLVKENINKFKVITLQDIGYLDMISHESGNHKLEYNTIYTLKL